MMEGGAMDGPTGGNAIWVDAGRADVLDSTDRHIVRLDDKQILVLRAGDQLWACNNRCPHEGYPLSEGTLTDGCIVTCNWHNWKFDLKSGDTVVGGDRLRRYTVRIRDERIWIDISSPPADEIIETALQDLSDCFADHEYDRMAREVARIEAAGGSALRALNHTLAATHDRFEYGMTHAIAAGADWLRLFDENKDDPARRLAAVVEVIGNLAWDSRRMPEVPFTSESRSFDRNAFLTAVENEDEHLAIAYARGAINKGLSFDDLYETLCRAALAHYQDFGHSLIYVNKSCEFLERAGNESFEPVLLMLVRSLIFATREDLIPEFKAYRPALVSTPQSLGALVVDELKTNSVAQCLERIAESDATPEETYNVLMEAAAWQLLHLDLSFAETVTGPVQDNVGWLDVTHTITFANAVRTTCSEIPDLWLPGLLQIGCFLGRNGKYMNAEIDEKEWTVSDPQDFAEAARQKALHHGEAEYIVAAHIVKLATAISDEIAAAPTARWTITLAAGLNRFLNSPLRRKNPIRTASQALEMVRREA